MSKRNRREHGRILSVETLQRGDSLAADVASGAASITVNDAGDFDEDGGWLYIGAQTVEYTACDDDTGIITLATALTAAGEQGDPVQVWSDLYDEVVDYQLALVELDGEYDNPDPVVAEVAEGVGDLPEGDRGKAGESCTLKRVADDEWEVVGVGGRPRRSRSIRFEADDVYTLTAADVTAGTVTFGLTHRPINKALTCVLAGVPQQPTEWAINYDAQTLTMPLSGWEKAGDVVWVHYAYRKGLRGTYLLPFTSTGWKCLAVTQADAVDRSAVAFDDSGWVASAAPFGDQVGVAYNYIGLAWPAPATAFPVDTGLWLRRSIVGLTGQVSISVRCDNFADIYWNGALVGSNAGDPIGEFMVTATATGTDVLAVHGTDDVAAGSGDHAYLDVKVEGSLA